MAAPNITADMAQFFDFGEASDMVDSLNSPAISRPASRAGGHRVGCPAHGQEGDEGCLCSAFYQDVSLPDTLGDDAAPIEEEFNTDFSSWLPRYQKPANPCTYCRSKGLECFIYNSGEGNDTGCSPCNALFRPCSFSSPEKMPMQMKRTALDTLHSVEEVSERTFGALTGRKQMRCLGHQGPIEENDTEDNAPKKGAAAARFPRAAVKILKDWMVANIDHPYPTEEQKEMLAKQTDLSVGQISNWMANTRRRQKARPKRCSSPSIRPSTRPLNIPPGRTWESLNPFERWKHSPPENEPAPLQAIAANVESFDFPDENPKSSASSNRQNSNGSTGSFSVFRAPSTTSLETGLTRVSSGSLGSLTSATFSQSSHHSLGSFSSLKSKERRRRRRMPIRAPKLDHEDDGRIFQCTFCTDRFKSKYDWARHEKSLHLSMEKWICAPLGDIITCSSSGQRKCTYCDEIDPSNAHLESHNHRGCEEKGREARTFYRKDHLRQHLRLMHGCKMIPSMESWKAEVQTIKSRCGFCETEFDKWQDRVDHLAKEFRNGANMKNWKGCRGLDPHIAQHVTNAMPPYLIANETRSPNPFSASHSHSMTVSSKLAYGNTDLEYLIPQDSNVSPKTATGFHAASSGSPETAHNTSSQSGTSPNQPPHPYATCWEILTLRLGQFAREHIEQHGSSPITDAMLQSRARLILYDEDDPWHQTAADNPEWLSLFRKAHGLDATTGPAVSSTLEPHEVLEDLGIGAQAHLDKSFNLAQFSCVRIQDPVLRAQAYQCALSGSTALLDAGQMTVPASGSHNVPGLTASPTTSNSSANGTGAGLHLPTSSFADFAALNAASMTDFAPAPGAGGLCIGDDGEIRSTLAPSSSHLNAFMTPISELSCNSGGVPISNSDFGFPVSAFSGAGQQDFNNTGTSGLGMGMSGGIGMAWDDSELTFDMDLDFDVDMDLGAGVGGMRQMA